MNRRRKIIGLGGSLAISLSLLFWAWHGTDWREVWSILTGLEPFWTGLSLGMIILSFYLRANRWGVLLNQSTPSNTLRLRQASVFIGLGSNCIFPFNAGELIRANLLNRLGKLPLGLVLGSLVSERVLDAITAFSLLAFSGLTLGPKSQGLWLPLLGLGSILIGIIFSLYLAVTYQQHLITLLHSHSIPFLAGHWERQIVSGFTGLLSSFVIFKSPRRLVIATAQSYLIWGLGGIGFWLLLKAFNLSQPGFIGALFILCFQAIAAVIPSSPGHLGTFEAAMRFALSLFEVPLDGAIAYTIMTRVMIYGTLVVFGLGYALRLGLRSIQTFATQPRSNRK